jgi:GntR family transcriptional repressor for pyruvate dehydrogenase complex
LADTEFHRQIAQATKNKTLVSLMNTITRFLTEAWKASLRIPQRPQKTIIEHQAIVDAINSHDAKTASKEMATHLTNAVKEIRKYGQG